jgi:uncharacterized protein YheU (UPF0270 family)
MSDYVQVPPDRLDAPVLEALLEEYATRDGTDYGEQEMTLAAKVQGLRVQLDRGDVQLLYDTQAEQWDLVTRLEAENYLSN